MFDDELGSDESLDLKANGAAARYQGSVWRPQIARKLIARARLIWAWARVTVFPRYGWKSAFSMLLITAGRLGDAASFVAATHILAWAFREGAGDGQLDRYLTWAAVSFAGLVGLGSILGYLGSRLAVKTVLAYESSCLVEGVSILHAYKQDDKPLPDSEAVRITKQAPRMMARSLLQLVHLCTSLVLMLTGFVVCVGLFPEMIVIIAGVLIVLSPLYILSAVYSTDVGHRIAINSSGYAGSTKAFQKKWINAKVFKFDEALDELREDMGYRDFHAAYGQRLTLSARNHLLSSLTLAATIGVCLLWIAKEVDLNSATVTSIVSFLVFLRVFANGLAGVFNGVQTFNTFIPFYLLYLKRDPRFIPWR
ncbi:hypothetical protein [Pseudaminobacter salicylatoxidans]|uniref:hypothetical protein n=1 Tax=Pseudaminobacter salicylatoxidans TaxID=93369 RepID=UPI00035C7A5F|nr:hypothetical protein [Pseudaminobacter salicylatoxidans]